MARFLLHRTQSEGTAMIEEKRKLERFSLQAPTIVEAERRSGSNVVLNLITKDICSAGAFVVTPEPLEEGEYVRLKMFLPLNTLRNILGSNSRVSVNVRGRVVRSDDLGMAIAFEGRHKISLDAALPEN
jgi:hypothetical protein